MVNMTKVPKGKYSSHCPLIWLGPPSDSCTPIPPSQLYHNLLFFPSAGSPTPNLSAMHEGTNVFNSLNVVIF